MRIDADIDDVRLLNRLVPPVRGERFGGGIHVVIPEDWETRVANGERAIGVLQYFLQTDAETRGTVCEIQAPRVEPTREALAKTQRPEDVERATTLSTRLEPRESEPAPEPDPRTKEPTGGTR